MGKINSGVKCSVAECSEIAVRSVSAEKAKSAGLNVPPNKRVYVCRSHYKILKKKTKKESMIEKLRWEK